MTFTSQAVPRALLLVWSCSGAAAGGLAVHEQAACASAYESIRSVQGDCVLQRDTLHHSKIVLGLSQDENEALWQVQQVTQELDVVKLEDHQNATVRNVGRMDEQFLCNVLINAHDMHQQSRCPAQCPFFTERMFDESKPCFFSCVRASECGKIGTDPLARVPDKEHSYCRRCSVIGCEKCADVASDVCSECAPGYELQHGQCKSSSLALWVVVLIIVSVLILFILTWLLDLLCRRMVNQAGMQEGQAFRARCILRQPSDGSLYPLTTSLLRSPIAGRGTALFFNFQLFLILWTGAMLLGWILFAPSVGGSDIFQLGFQQADTPRQFCMVVHNGFTKQHSLMWIKWSFCLAAYGLSFVGALVYAVIQERRFQMWDAESTTLMDFAARCTGLPHDVGATKVEDELVSAIATHCGECVVGASVCWDRSSQCLQIDLEEEEEFGETGNRPLTPQMEGFAANGNDDERSKQGLFRRMMDKIDSLVALVLGIPDGGSQALKEAGTSKIKDSLEEIRSTGNAFVVFETEAGRDRALQHLEATGGLSFRGSKLQLEACDCEPDTVLWKNMHVLPSRLFRRIAMGVAVLLLLLVLWVVMFFVPAALYLASFTNPHDPAPSILYSLLFTLLVVLGNQIMYNASDIIASKIGFHYEDDRQVAYVSMYTMACVLQVVLDIGLMTKTSYREMVGLGVRTDDGTFIGLLRRYEEIFQAYAIQRAVGQHLYSYVWPATFLVPFLIEPVGTILLPYALQRYLVGCKTWIVGRAAEKSMAHFTPMDLSRYGDILLNVSLVALFAFLPPGFWTWVLGFVLLSHIYIYALDHWRVLRAMPAFCFSTDRMHKVAQQMFALPLATLLAAAVFKSNCAVLANGTRLPCAHDAPLLARCLGAAACHVLLHLALLRSVVPMLGRLTICAKEPSQLKYSEVARSMPRNWFSVNAVHCLRCKHVYQHAQPPHYFHLGDT